MLNNPFGITLWAEVRIGRTRDEIPDIPRKKFVEKRRLSATARGTFLWSKIPSDCPQESLDELDDDDAGEKTRREEEELVQANTVQNEAMTADPSTGHLMETPRSGSGRHKSSAGPGSEEDMGGNSRQRHNRHGRDGGAAASGSLEKRMEELEKELARERQETARLLKAHQDKDDLIGKLKEEIDLLNRDLDDIEDENEQLKQENKTLLKVVGQLTRISCSSTLTSTTRPPLRFRRY
eukprot:superscaffoldBa00002853_g15463